MLVRSLGLAVAIGFLMLASAYGIGWRRPGVKVIANRDDPNALAAALAPVLAHLRSDFLAGRKELPTVPSEGGRAYTREAVESLLRKTESSLGEALRNPQLAAMRDAVEEVFREARKILADSRQDALLERSRVTAVSAVLSSARRSTVVARVAERESREVVLQEVADKSLDLVLHLLEQLTGMADDKALAVDFCVKSTPVRGAHFSMRPRSYPAGVREVQATDDTIPSVVRGLYIYRVEPAKRGSKYPPAQCGWEGGEDRDCLNLLKNPGNSLVCDLAQGSCRLADAKCP